MTDSNDGYDNPRKTDDKIIWDCVYFGKYTQTGLFEKEPIEWRVLSVDGNEALLLADKGLDCKQFNDKETDTINEDKFAKYSCTWETSTLRTWLNDDFFNEVSMQKNRRQLSR